MKKEYSNLSKDEKLKIRKEFYATKKGQAICKHLKNAKIYALLAILYAFYLIIDFIIKKSAFYDLIIAIFVLIFGIGSIIYAHHIKIKKINELISSNQN